MKNKIQEDLKNALKAKDARLTASLREILSTVTVAEKKVGKALSDDELKSVLSSLSKRLGKTGDEYMGYATKDTADNEMPEAVKDDLHARAEGEYYTKSVVDAYLPAQMTDAEIASGLQYVMATIDATDPKQNNIGYIIGMFKKRHHDKMFDAGVLSKLIKQNK